MRRIVSVWLIDWPVTVRARSAGHTPPDPFAADAGPHALILRTARGAMIHALNPAARALNLSRGQTQADALAMIPHLVCHPADPVADARALDALAIWAERWSPSVTVDPSDGGLEGLFLDLTGATHLFGGEAETVAAIEQRLGQAAIRARCAMAPSPGAAWALARWGQGVRIATDQTLGDALAPLPVEALRIDDAALKQARRFGLKTIGSLYAMPRAGLARRFRDGAGVGLVRRLDQALGATAEGLTPTRAPPRYRGWEAYADPLTDTAGIEARLPDLCDRLARTMEGDGQGARALTLTAFRVDGRTSAVSVRMGRALREVSIWMRLFRETGIERIDPGFGIDALMLTADTEPVIALQTALGDEDQTRHAEGRAALIDRLSARLGEAAVQIATPQGSWMPERAERWRPALTASPRLTDGVADPGRTRPLLMLDPPEPVEAIAELPDGAPARFTWRRVSRRVARADGPERLSPEWWRPRPDGRQVRTRDYYRVEDDQGLRYWLFREGLYGPEYTGAPDERPPSWWMHGMFA
ncbi:MAG: DNA polymerase Y family protein [Alphaproteobacteria bacterium]|nr:DNA polymerase Y family protein [Alphaproteobacteria bacterium]